MRQKFPTMTPIPYKGFWNLMTRRSNQKDNMVDQEVNEQHIEGNVISNEDVMARDTIFSILSNLNASVASATSSWGWSSDPAVRKKRREDIMESMENQEEARFNRNFCGSGLYHHNDQENNSLISSSSWDETDFSTGQEAPCGLNLKYHLH